MILDPKVLFGEGAGASGLLLGALMALDGH